MKQNLNNLKNNEIQLNKQTKIKTYNIFSSISFLTGLVFVFYTFIKNAEGIGVLSAIIVGPFLLLPQAMLCIVSNIRKSKMKIFKSILIVVGIVSSIIIFSMVNYKINIFGIVNILILATMLIMTLRKDID